MLPHVCRSNLSLSHLYLPDPLNIPHPRASFTLRHMSRQLVVRQFVARLSAYTATSNSSARSDFVATLLGNHALRLRKYFSTHSAATTPVTTPIKLASLLHLPFIAKRNPTSLIPNRSFSVSVLVLQSPYSAHAMSHHWLVASVGQGLI